MARMKRPTSPIASAPVLKPCSLDRARSVKAGGVRFALVADLLVRMRAQLGIPRATMVADSRPLLCPCKTIPSGGIRLGAPFAVLEGRSVPPGMPRRRKLLLPRRWSIPRRGASVTLARLRKPPAAQRHR
mmetsp:Transcript_1520/g.3661  ORF Transcript_1520/g.3661 Transcript_1520/m.3661 type:complete len:130 (+) Transcript_1520:896-1285(+)